MMVPELLFVLFAVAALMWLALVALESWRGSRVRARRDPAAIMHWAERAGRLTKRAAWPAAIAALVLGVLAVRSSVGLDISSNWWIGTGLGAWLVAFFGSTLPRGLQLTGSAQLAGHTANADDEDAQWMVRQTSLTTHGELLLLTVALAVIALEATR